MQSARSSRDFPRRRLGPRPLRSCPDRSSSLLTARKRHRLTIEGAPRSGKDGFMRRGLNRCGILRAADEIFDPKPATSAPAVTVARVRRALETPPAAYRSSRIVIPTAKSLFLETRRMPVMSAAETPNSVAHLQQPISEMCCNRRIAIKSVVRVLRSKDLVPSDVCG